MKAPKAHKYVFKQATLRVTSIEANRDLVETTFLHDLRNEVDAFNSFHITSGVQCAGLAYCYI